jgi:PAS domain S-box-containing protein
LKGAQPGLSLRGYLVLNVLAILIPGLAFASILFFRYYTAELARIDADLQSNARELALALDRDLEGQQYTLQTLSIAQLVAARNFEAFHRQASRVRGFTGVDVLLRDRAGQQLLNTRVPYGTPLPPPYRTDGDEEVIKTRKPYVTNLVIGGVVQRPLYAVTAPVLENGEVAFFLHFSLELQRLVGILRAGTDPSRVAGIFDRNFKIMTRTDGLPDAVGKPAPESFIAHATTANEDVWLGVNTSGEKVRLGFARSQVAEWWIWVSIPEATVQNSLRRALWAPAALGVLLTGLGLFVAYLLARRFSSATASLSASAAALGRGERVVARPLPVREFNEVGRELEAGSVARAELEIQLVRKATQESEQKFQMLVQGVTDCAIFMLDRDGNVTNWNPGAARIKGYSDEEILGRHFSCFYSEEDRRRELPAKALRTAVEAGKYEIEGWRVRKDGTRFWASVLIDPIFQHGKLVGFAKITRDITEKREAQRQLESAREQLYQSQKMDAVGQLTGGVAHDFNNLLTIIIGNLDTAKRTLDSWKDGAQERLARAIDHATIGARRAATLTGHLLAFSRRQPLEPKTLDVNRLLSHLSGFLKPSLGEKVQLEVVGMAGLWQIEADPTHLETAILNLAVNARDAMPEGGKLTVEATNVLLDEEYCRAHTEVKPGQYVQIALTDTGVGMIKEISDRAFDPFFTTKASGQGTGLGLSQVYGFVKQSGGHVKIYSEAGQGTTVKIYLPRATGVAHEIELQDAAVPSAYGSETIMLVEDDADVRAFISEALRELNYRVLEAADSRSALALLDKERAVDLLLTDVILPGANGRELANAASARRPELKIVFMTGYSRNAIVHQGRLDPGVDLIQKPVTQAALATKIRTVLDRSG